MNISVYCSCTEQYKIKTKTIRDFIKETTTVKQCSMHTNKLEHHCVKCFKWICKECYNEHMTEHDLEPCSQQNKPISQMCNDCKKEHIVDEALKALSDLIDSIRMNNQQSVSNFIEKINAKAEVSQMKDDIESVNQSKPETVALYYIQHITYL